MHYVGVFEHDTASNYRPVTLFTSVAGRKPNLTVYYSGWGMPFRARFATAAARAGAVVLVHMEPWHQSLAAIAAGDSDRYLRRFAAAVRRYGGPRHHQLRSRGGRPVVPVGMAACRPPRGGWRPGGMW